jgi:hypothetical protein
LLNGDASLLKFERIFIKNLGDVFKLVGDFMAVTPNLLAEQLWSHTFRNLEIQSGRRNWSNNTHSHLRGFKFESRFCLAREAHALQWNQGLHGGDLKKFEA